METRLGKTLATLLLVALGLLAKTAYAQGRYIQTNATTISISGTSTIHDWTMKSSAVTSSAEFEVNASGEFTKLNSLQVVVPAESLKSGKGGMDKNAYSALKTDKFKQITFQIVSSKIEGNVIQCEGKLKIAGVVKDISLKSTYSPVSGGALQAKGSVKLLMSDYGVEPPTFMFGSVTTGNEITVSFDVTLAPVKTIPVTLN